MSETSDHIFEGYRVHLKHPQHQTLIFPLFYRIDGKEWGNDPLKHWQDGYVKLHFDEREFHIIPICNIDWIEQITIRVS